MRKLVLIAALALVLPACEKKASEPAGQAAESAREFAVVEGTTQEAVDELKAQQSKVIQQVLDRHGLAAEDLTVTTGSPSGLGITVKHSGGKKVKLEVPPSPFGAELVTNFDHTLDKAVRRAAGIE